MRKAILTILLYLAASLVLQPQGSAQETKADCVTIAPNPSSPCTPSSTAIAYNDRALEAEKRGEIDAAYSYLRSGEAVAEQVPSESLFISGAILNNLGVIECRRGNFESSEIAFLRAMDKARALRCKVGYQFCAQARAKLNLSEPFYNAGVCYIQQNKHREALVQLRAALTFNPNASHIHTKLHVVLRALNDPAGALDHLYASFRLEADASIREKEFNLIKATNQGGMPIRGVVSARCCNHCYYNPVKSTCVDPVLNSEVSYQTVDVLFGTDRAKLKGSGRLRFGKDGSGELVLGKAQITIPIKDRLPGEIPRPWAIHSWLNKEESPKDYFTVANITLLSMKRFLEVAAETPSNGSRFAGHSFIFIHGYNVAFDDALYRAAQIKADIGFDGPVFTYSWPSAGELIPYKADQERAGKAVAHLARFLDLVSSHTKAEKLHVLSHSMGNYVFLEALDLLRKQKGWTQPRFAQVVLAAPDVGIKDFVRLFPNVRALAKGVTLYASRKDVALKASTSIFWREQRAGDLETNGSPVIVDGMDSIDVSLIGTDFLGHSSYGDRPTLLNDVGLLFVEGVRPPDTRALVLQPANAGKGMYWIWPKP